MPGCFGYKKPTWCGAFLASEAIANLLTRGAPEKHVTGCSQRDESQVPARFAKDRCHWPPKMAVAKEELVVKGRIWAYRTPPKGAPQV